MSGHKKTTVKASISEEEYRRLHEEEMRAQFSPHIAEEVKQEVTNSVLTNYQMVEKRQGELQQILSGLNQNIQEFEAKTSQHLLDQQQHLVDMFDQQGGNLQTDFSQLLVQAVDQFNHHLNEEKTQRQGDFELVNQKIDQLYQGEKGKMQAAKMWYDQSFTLYQFITENYPCEQIIPGEIESQWMQLDLAQHNIVQGMPEAGLVKAQDVYINLSSMRLYIEHYLSELSMLHQAAWVKASQLYEVLINNSTCKAIDMEGKLLDIPIQIDYWSPGKLTKLVSQLEQVLNYLESGDSLPDIDTLRVLIEQDLPGIEKDFSDTVYQARLAAMQSQLRVNIADIVIQALKDQGYSLDYHDYHHHDMRQGYKAKVVNIAGSEVVITIDPIAEESGKNSLDIKSNDREPRTEHELKQRSKEITRALSIYGLQIGPVDVIQDKSQSQKPLQEHERLPRRQN